MNRMKVRFIAAVFLFLLLILSVCFFTKTVTAQRSYSRSKLVASIEVKKGDTLWSIASEYMSDDYVDVNEYIDEIKASNGLTSDEIHAGNYIIVPYYADASY
jgi:LysM repeat protein